MPPSSLSARRTKRPGLEIMNQNLKRCSLSDLPGAAKRIYRKVVKVEFLQHPGPPLKPLRIQLPDFRVMAYKALILPPYVLIDDSVYHAIYNITLFNNLIL